MNTQYQQALAAMAVGDVEFILSQLGTGNAPPAQARSSNDAITGTSPIADDEEARRRRHIEREWPETGTGLWSEYYGERYTADVIPANKRLKSGKQIRITSGPALGTVCDSFSEAMIIATEEQRRKQFLGRKGTSNGRLFWQWDGKPGNIAGDSADDASDD